jgi:hypothetical protein
MILMVPLPHRKSELRHNDGINPLSRKEKKWKPPIKRKHKNNRQSHKEKLADLKAQRTKP